MADARTTYDEILTEIDGYHRSRTSSVEFRWIAEYFTREAVFYQFTGGCRADSQAANGQRFDGPLGTVGLLSPHLAVGAFAEFARNDEILFYRGSRTSTSSIFEEILACFTDQPEIIYVEIVKKHLGITTARCTTRLLFVGFNRNWIGLPSSMPCAEIVASDNLLHPFWCRDRYQPKLPAFEKR
ncbi:hypothetical protein [Rhizobium grahamii]|uniref:Uncharacterized protein n=1 Tax=Rhizobium grahamii CCGE 502 TaxID=990285 RepID=S3HE94_9HYPH|nr:hypothetical protein [Rhizobium grahamii]EPE97049.1 hypothetical protein RGCCGE502_16835 [Rhizobium grahamii CCGE 502]